MDMTQVPSALATFLKSCGLHFDDAAMYKIGDSDPEQTNFEYFKNASVSDLIAGDYADFASAMAGDDDDDDATDGAAENADDAVEAA